MRAAPPLRTLWLCNRLLRTVWQLMPQQKTRHRKPRSSYARLGSCADPLK